MRARSRRRRRVSWTKWVARGRTMNKSTSREQGRRPVRAKERRVKRVKNTIQKNTRATWRLLSRFRRRSYRSKSSQLSSGNRMEDLNLGILMPTSLYCQNLEAIGGTGRRKVLLQVKKASRIRKPTSLVQRSWLPLLQRKRTLLLII
jgi:hypothetical protein